MSEIKQPYIGTSRDRLTQLINDSNPNQAALVEGRDFQYGQPLSTTKPGYNTRVRLKSLHPEQSSDVFVYYNRLPLDILHDLPQGFIQEVYIDKPEFSIHESIAAINYALGLNLTIQEVKDETFITNVSTTYPLTISGDDSFAWLDNTTYNFHIRTIEFWLSDIWQTTLLEGLFPPA